MVDEEQYCIDVLTQVSAMTKALEALALAMLDEHLSHCVVRAARAGGEEAETKLREASEAIARLAEPPARSRKAEMITSYTVSGMTCNHCVHAVTEEVSAVPGVTGVDVSLETGKLDITSDAPVDFDRIVEAVYEAGEQYSVA